MIIRTQHNRQNPYAQINKRVLEDDRLSWKAKGVLCYLLSRPDNWKTHVNQLVTVSTDQETSTRTAIAELIKAGYIQRFRRTNAKGVITAWQYVISEDPVENPDVENPDVENQALINNEFNITEFSDQGSSSRGEPEKPDFEAIALAEKAAYLAKQKLGEEIVRKRQRNFYEDAIWGVLAKEMGKDPKSVFEAFKSHVENHAKKAGKSDPVKWAEAVIHKLFEVEGSEANNSLWQEFEAIALGRITPLEKETGRKDLSASPPVAPEPSQAAREKLKALRGGVA